MTEEETSHLLAVLAKANDFDRATLELNREGRLSDTQRAKLTDVARHYYKSRNAAVITVIISAGVTFYGILSKSLGVGPLTFEGWGEISILCSMIWLVPVWFEHAKYAADLSEPIVKLSGIVTKTSYGSGSEVTYCYVFGNRKIWVGDEAYEALIPNIPYRLYYLAHTGKLLSIEPEQRTAMAVLKQS